MTHKRVRWFRKKSGTHTPNEVRWWKQRRLEPPDPGPGPSISQTYTMNHIPNIDYDYMIYDHISIIIYMIYHYMIISLYQFVWYTFRLWFMCYYFCNSSIGNVHACPTISTFYMWHNMWWILLESTVPVVDTGNCKVKPRLNCKLL